MEALSSFAISIAAGIALEIFNKPQATVEKEIKKAFEKALKKWSPNTSTRKDFRESLKFKLKQSLTNPKRITDLQSSAKGKFEMVFFIEFDKAIAEFQSAFNYLKEIKDLERFKEEITSLSKIEKKVSEIDQKVDKLLEISLPQSNDILEAEWKRQIALYKEEIEHLKPKSSIKHLIALEESFKEHDIQPSKSLKSYLEFLKAQCYELTGKSKEAYQCYIKAKNLNPIPLEIREKACISYTKLNQPKESLELTNEILQEDEFNPMAWAVKVILSDEPDLEKRFENVPSIVKKDPEFQRIVYFKTITDAKVQNKVPVYQNNDFFKDFSGYSKSPLTYSNYNDRLFFIETTVHSWLSNHYFDFISGSIHERSKLEKIHQILGDFLEQLSESEIKANRDVLQFYRGYLDHKLYGNAQVLKTMKLLFPKIRISKDLLGLMLANCLQLSGETDEALEVINSFEYKSFELMSLELFCLVKKRDVESYATSASVFLQGLNKIDNLNCYILIPIIDSLSEFGKLDAFDFEHFFRKIESDPPSLKILALNFYRILKGEYQGDIFKELNCIESEIISEKSNIRFFLPYCYFLLKEYDSAINCFEQYLIQDYESRDFHYYILSIYQSKTNHKKLLYALENWRKNCSFKEMFLKIEIELNERLQNWKKCLEIAECSLLVNPNDEWFLTSKILSLSKLDLPDKARQLEETITNLLGIGINDLHHIRIVANILIENGEYQKALDLLYEKAKDIENIPARMEYFLSVTKIPNNFFEIPEKVGFGHYVKYSRKGKLEDVKIVEGNALSPKLTGRKVGDRVAVQDPITKELDTLEILGIMDKYHYLHWQIMQQVEKSPYSGLPFHSFELPSNDPDALKEKLITLFGANGSQEKILIEKAISEYYDYNISLTEVIIRVYRSEYFGGYFNLVHNRKGVMQLPLEFYSNHTLGPDSKFVLDFSSLIIFHQITKSTGKEFPNKFLIANGFIQYIKLAINNESKGPKETLSANITLEGIEVQKNNQNIASHNVSYYRSVLEWVDKYCEVIIAESKLDYESAINLEDGEDKILFQLFVENIVLLNEVENLVLVTDDHLYFKFNSISKERIISTEFYINQRSQNPDEYIFELVKNRYIGLSISKDLLLSEYLKKRNGGVNFYLECLLNCSLRISNTLKSARTVVEFLKELALNPLVTDKVLSLESANAFVVLLSGQSNQDVFKAISFFLERNFQLLGEKNDIVKQSFLDAVSIITKK